MHPWSLFFGASAVDLTLQWESDGVNRKNVISAWKKRDFIVTSKRVKIARFPHATGSLSAHSYVVPHPFAVIENVVEESLA